MHGYTATVRNVPEKVKHEVFNRYGIDWVHHADYEVDHWISLEICGLNTIENLWPQLYIQVPYTARHKDQLEDYAHREACDGRITLAQAQALITGDWVQAYKTCCEAKAIKNAAKKAQKAAHP